MQNNQSLNKIHFLNITLLTVCVVLMCQFENYEVSGIECGTKNVSRPLIKGGDRIIRGEWPFIVALYRVDESKFFCGGTLISAQHVLTAAHCMQEKYWPIKLTPDEISVRIGAHNLTAKSERGVAQRNVSAIYVHPDWDVYDDRYDADIAILVLSANVTFTSYIRPICIPADGVLVDGASIDVEGSVVGWGLAEREIIEEIPKQAVTNALNDSYCYRRDNGIVVISSARTFCGGDGVGLPNKGDSGGGFFVMAGSAWAQYGIISAIRTNSTGHITTNSLAAYTNVKMFKNWIVDTVTQSGGEVGESIEINKIIIDLNCVYIYGNISKRYECFVLDLLIRSDNNEVGSFTGFHNRGKTNADVEQINLKKGTMFYIPDGIGKFFKNVKKIEITEFLRTKLIRRSNLMNMESLVDLVIWSNDIHTFEEDSLWDLPNLEIFVLTKNNLKMIKGKTFEVNSKLRGVWLNFNHLEFIPENLFQHNLLLEKVFLSKNYVKTIDENTFVNNSKLKEVGLSENKLEFLPAQLFEFNFLLEKVFLSNNSIKAIDENMFANNSKLSVVYLQSNRLESIPGNLFESNLLLQKMFAFKNSLRLIDERTFQRNEWLKEVSLNSNQLEFIPSNLFANNFLLQTVLLNENYIKTIDGNTFVNNSKLREVWLNSNNLEQIPGNLFENNLLLEKFYAYKNTIKLMDEKTFHRNSELREVLMHSNKLEVLPENLFQTNSLLETIDFSNNSLKIIEIDFTGFKHIKQIWLYNNICIDGLYEGRKDANAKRNQFRSLSEFQNIIRANCSSVSP